MNVETELLECAHLCVVGDTQCRICFAPLEESVLSDDNMDAEGVDWGTNDAPEAAASWSPEDYSGATAPTANTPQYPEYGPLPEAPISVNFRPGDKPQITVRGNTAAEITAALNDLEAHGVYANLAAAMASMNAQGPLGAGLGPVTPVTPQGPPPGLPQGPPQAGPPFGPNVSVPGAPNYQGPPQPQWQQGGQQSGGWGGGGGARGNTGPQSNPRPQGWAQVDVPFNDKERFKQMRAQGTESGMYLRGKIKWFEKGIYWVEPSVAAWVAQQGFPVTQ